MLTMRVEGVVGTCGVEQEPLEAGEVLGHIPGEEAINRDNLEGHLLRVGVDGEGLVQPALDPLQHPQGQLVLQCLHGEVIEDGGNELPDAGWILS